MKNWVGILALCVSLVVFALSAWMYKQADAREKALIEKYRPRVEKVFRDFGVQPPENPQTLDELFDPIMKLVERLS